MPCDAGTYSALDIAAPLQLLFLLLNTPVTEIACDLTRARGDSCSWNTEALIFINFDSAAATTAAATSCTAGEEVDGSAAAAGEEIMYPQFVIHGAFQELLPAGGGGVHPCSETPAPPCRTSVEVRILVLIHADT
jgi:hypothetical protein